MSTTFTPLDGHVHLDRECPVTLEHFAPKGPHQPRFLPGCGHTLSRAGIEALLGAAERKRERLQCPICARASPTVASVEDCLPNWALIQSIDEHMRSQRRSDSNQYQANNSHQADHDAQANNSHQADHDAQHAKLGLSAESSRASAQVRREPVSGLCGLRAVFFHHTLSLSCQSFLPLAYKENRL
jgi:hypothetical protein